MKNTYFSVKPGAKGSEFYGGGNSQGLSDKGTKYQGLSDQVPSDQVPSTNYRTTSVECSGNHPVITLLSPRNHPLLGSDGQVVTDRGEVLADRRGVLADRREVLADRRGVVAMMRQKCMMWKYVAMLLAVFVLSVGNIGKVWGVEFKPYLAEGFEGTLTFTTSSCTANNTTDAANARTGSKVCYAYPSSGSSSARYMTAWTQTADKDWYIHAIVWVKGDNVASGKVQHQIGPYQTAPATDYVNTTTSYARCTITPLKSGGSAKQIRLYFISNNGTPVAHFWYDDFIMYLSSEDVATDLTKPSPATNASATTSSITWSEGSDTGTGATGVQATYIWHRTKGSGENGLTLNDQGIYSPTTTKLGPINDQSGNWTLIDSIAGGTLTAFGTYIAGDNYAIVHRDLAYNYSTPTYVTVAAGGGCGSTEQATLTLSSSSGTICGTGTTTFTVSGGSGTGALSVSSSAPSKATASISGSTVTVTGVAAGSATITVTKACDATYAEKTATYSATVAAVPTANAGVDKTTEPGEGVALAATAAASGCTGAWTIVSGPNTATSQLSSTSSETATFTPTVAGTYTLRWTVTNASGCSAYDEMTVTAAVAPSGPSTSADTPGAEGEITFESWTDLETEQNYWKDGIKFWPYAWLDDDIIQMATNHFTTDVPVHGYQKNITAGSEWGSYTMSGLTTFGLFAMGISVKEPSVVEIIVDNNQNNDETLANLNITQDDVDYDDEYTAENYTTGDDIKTNATITRVDAGTGRYKVSIPVTASDLESSDPYIIKLSAATWSDPGAFVFESVTIVPSTKDYTVTAVTSTGTDTYGTVVAEDEALDEDETTTITATPATGYQVTNWAVSGTGASISPDGASNSNTTTLTMGTANARVTATFGPKSYTISYKDQGDVAFSGTHETGYPTSHTYGSATALKKATKTGYAFAGWYTTSTCTGDAITSIGATAYTANITLYARWVELDLHEPGVYEKPTSEGGYGRVLKHATVNAEEHDYEVYLFTIENSNGSIYAGPKTSISDGKAMFTEVAANTEAQPSDTWFSFKADSYAVDEATVRVDEFSQLTSTTAIGDSRYAVFKASSYLRLRVSGYSEFAFIGRDNKIADSKLFRVRIDGVTQDYTHNETDRTVFRFDLGDTGEHFIEITTTTNNSNRFRGFSLRLPDVTRYTVSATNTDGYGSVDVTSISNVRSGSTIYTSSNTLTVGGTTVTATENSTTAQYSYAFNNWTKSDGTSLPGTVTGAITVRANFTQTPVNYTLAWNANGGDALSGTYTSGSTGYGTSITAPNDPTRSGYTFTGWNSASNGSGNYYTGYMPAANTTYYAQWEVAATLTAISADRLYQAAEMANITFTGSDQNFTGLSTNNLFKVYGDATGETKTAAKGKNENHNVTDDISEKNFTSALYILSNSNTTSTDDPTQGAIEIITPSTPGILYLYLDANNSALTLKKQGTSTSTSLSGAAYKAMPVDANTHYFINGSSSGKRGLYGIQYVSTYAVSITPTNVTKATGDATAIKGKAYTATFTANMGYTLPNNVTVSIGGTPQTKGSGYTWTISGSTATLTVPAANVTGAIAVTVSGVAAATYTLTTTVGTSGAATGGATITNGVVASIPSGTTVTNNGDNTFTINTASPTTVTASASVSGVAGPDDDACTYAFTGWENLPATVTADVSNIHALYEARFTIRFKETDGTAVAGISSTYYVYETGKAVSTFPTPTKSGYTFVGWYTDDALTSPATDLDDEAYGAIDYYAKWTPKTTTITLDKNNSDEGSTDGSATVTYGSDELATYTAATRTGYTISTYKTETSGGYIIIKNDGSLNSGDKGAILDDGHWSYDGTALTLYAQWEANKYDVTHTLSNVSRSSGGEEGSNKATYGTGYSVVFAAASGYALPAAVTVTVGGSDVTANCTWNQGSGELTIPAAYVTGDIVITVTGVLTCTDPGLGFESLSLTKYTGESVSNTLTNTYSVAVSYSSIDEDVATVNSSGEVTIKGVGTTTITATAAAQTVLAVSYCAGAASYTLTVNPYTITYNLNGGDWGGVSHKDTYTKFDEGYDLPTPTKTNYTFLGWYANSEFTGGRVYILPAGSTGNKTYYAKWGSAVTATWTITAYEDGEDAFYKGGGGHHVTAVLDQDAWDDESGSAEDLDLSASEGVTLKNIEKSINGSGKAQVEADFSISGDIDEDEISFFLNVPAAGVYAAAELSKKQTLNDCPIEGGESSVDVWYNDIPTGKTNTSRFTFAAAPSGTNDDVQTLTIAGTDYTCAKRSSDWNSTFTFTIDEGKTAYLYFRIKGTNTRAITITNTSNSTSTTIQNIGTTFATYTSESLPAGSYSVSCNGNIYVSIIALQEISDVTSGVPTTLSWSGSLVDKAKVDKNDVDADFIYTATPSTNTIGAITYTSSNDSVATVDGNGKVHIIKKGETTITATLAESGCYTGDEITYKLNVESTCTDARGTIVAADGSAIAGNSIEKGACETVILKLTGYTDGATIQWKKDGADIIGATSAEYTVPKDGEGVYTAVTTKNCDLTSNSVTVTSASSTIEPTIFADEFTVKDERPFEYRLMQLNEGETCTVKSATSWKDKYDFEITTEGNIVTIKGDKKIESIYDETITLTISNGCSSKDKNILIHATPKSAKPMIAWIATGDKGVKDNVLADQSTNTNLYKALKATGEYALTPRNCYWTTDEKELIKEYSQYDLVILTDYPNSRKGPNSEDDRSKSYTNALGLLIDRVPMLTFEAFVAGCPNWGFSSNPENTGSTQNSLTLLCNANDIFDTSDTFNAGASVEVGTVAEVEGQQALQGFELDAMPNFVFIAKITDSGKDYVTCCERQVNTNARMMVFGLNQNLMNAITETGEDMVAGFVKYLLLDETASIPDCSVIFKGTKETGGTDWSNTSNWEGASLPNPYASVRIDAPCVVGDDVTAKAGMIKIHTGSEGEYTYTGSLTIQPQGRMIVENGVYRVDGTNYATYLPTEPNNLVINADEDHTGALIFSNPRRDTQATVYLYSKATTSEHTCWQYVGIPFGSLSPAVSWFYNAWMMKYTTGNTTGDTELYSWEYINNYDVLNGFQGYALTQTAAKSYQLQGSLAPTTDKVLAVSNAGAGGKGWNLYANSWTAPIHIDKMEASDFVNADATIYLYNTGSRANWNGSALDETGTSTTAGQYLAVPVGLAEYTGTKYIPSMQGFFVQGNHASAAGSVRLRYDAVVRDTTVMADLNTPLRTPSRETVNQEPEHVTMVVRGEKYTDVLHLFRSDEWSAGYENGYDAHKVEGDDYTPQLYAVTGKEELAVVATDEWEGTVLNFRAGSEDVEYTIFFRYNESEAEALYLYDLTTETYTRIENGGSYHFSTTDKETHPRFILTYNAPSVATGTGDVQRDDVQSTKARKVLLDNHVYIFRNGKLYDSTGKMVK